MRTKEELLEILLDIYADGGYWEELEDVISEIIDERDKLAEENKEMLETIHYLGE